MWKSPSCRIAARAVLLLAAAALGLAPAGASATLFVYKTPKGTRLVTDHVMSEPGYVLIHRSRTADGVGAVAAGRQPPALLSTRGDPTRYDPLIRRMARTYRLDPALVKAVIHAESSFDPGAISSRGAQGLMQLMPGTARRYGVHNVFDPEENVRAGTEHLRNLLEQFSDTSLALAAYNAGENAVERYRAIPPFQETRDYVRKVTSLRNRYSTKYY